MAAVFMCECPCADVMPPERRRAMRAALEGAGVDFEAGELCRLAAARDPRLPAWAAPGRVIVACHPRAVRWLLHAGGAPEAAAGARVVDLRAAEAPAALAEVLGAAPAPGGTSSPAAGAAGDDWVAWFPVIDYSRCTGCKQCLSFCLFGVYAEGEGGRVEVRQPRGCKTHCPACARICPRAAIVFPRCPDEPINGAAVRDEQAARAAAAAGAKEILGADPYAALLARRRRARPPLLKQDA
jgi:Pyruvate/2-oxoacid:ferredoxin oxidoreductase delta subunit